MEKKLVKIAKEILSSEKNLGVVVADTNGLCITAEGIGDKNLAPSLLKVIQSAGKLDESKLESMAIRIDCTEHYIDVKHHKNVITAIYEKY